MRTLLLAAFAVIALACPALAQVGANSATTVDLTPIYNALIGFVGVALTAALGFAANWFRQKTGIDLDLKHNAILNEAIERGLDFAKAQAAKSGQVNVGNETLAAAAGYVMTGAPAALKRFGITQARLEQMIEARLAPSKGG